MKTIQLYNLAKLTGIEVIDRFQLILEIFAQRASTSEAKLQIQLAQLQHELPHAKEKVRLKKLSEQQGFLGGGRYEVDNAYNAIRRQISHIRNKLKGIQKERRLHRARRRDLGFPLISLAGYTNAGKSTLFNTCTEETVPVDYGLFTTLSTTTRAIDLLGKKMLLTDTVGFIDRLPITLIEAFHSTLEETIFSDLLLLIIDISESYKEIERKLSCCLDTIQKIGAAEIPIVTALNKIDSLSNAEIQQKVEFLKDTTPNPVPISALYKTNIDLLTQKMTEYITNYVQVSITIPVTDESMSFLSWLHNRANVQNVEYKGDMIEIIFESVPWFADKVKGRTELLNGNFNS